MTAEVVDGATICINTTGTAPDSDVLQPPYISAGMDNINNDEEDKTNIPSSSSSLTMNGIQPVQQKLPIIQQMDKIQPSQPKVDKNKRRQYNDYFAQVDELKAYKEKHGHLNVHQKEDRIL